MPNNVPEIAIEEVSEDELSKEGFGKRYRWVLYVGTKDAEYNKKIQVSRIRSLIFGSLEDAKKDFFALRNWMNKVTHIK